MTEGACPDGREDEAGREQPIIRFILFIAGQEMNSVAALRNIKRICALYLGNRHRLEVVDVLNDFQKALSHEVFVTPTLLAHSTRAEIRIIGNLSNTNKVLAALEISEDGGER